MSQRLLYNTERGIRYFSELDSYLKCFSQHLGIVLNEYHLGLFIFLTSKPISHPSHSKMKVLRACHDSRCFIPLHFKINIALES